MLAWTLAVVVASAPRVHPDATSALYVPEVKALPTLLPFLEAAGKRSVVLNPQSFRAELHPLLEVDFTQPESAKAAGISPQGSLSVSRLRGARVVSCTDVADEPQLTGRLNERLARLGTAWSEKAGGARLFGAERNGKLVAGYALKGTVACAVTSDGVGDVRGLLRETARLAQPANAAAWKSRHGLSGVAYLLAADSTWGLRANGKTLQVEGVGGPARLAGKLRGAGLSPYAALAPEGVLTFRARLSPAGAEELAEQFNAHALAVCKACEQSALEAAVDAVRRQLTGPVALCVRELKVQGSLRGVAAQLDALRHAWVAEVRSPEAVRAALAKLPLESLGDHRWRLPLAQGALLLELEGKHLLAGNDELAFTALKGALGSAAGKMAHGAEVSVSPPQLARSLGRIGLLEVLGTPELAGLFAVSTELGPLLSVSRRVTGWADTRGRTTRFALEWALEP